MLYRRVTKIYGKRGEHGVKSGFFFTKGYTNIINEDLFTTRLIAPESIDLVITSPPYNVDIQYNSHDDQITYGDYLEFSQRWMERCYGWLKDDGRFCLNIPLDKNKGGQQSVGADLTRLQRNVGFLTIRPLSGTKEISRAGRHGVHG